MCNFSFPKIDSAALCIPNLNLFFEFEYIQYFPFGWLNHCTLINNKCLSFLENKEEDVCKKQNQLEWFPARKVEIPQELLGENYKIVEVAETSVTPDITLKIVCSEKVYVELVEAKCKNIVEAESEHSDLLPAKYEGRQSFWFLPCQHKSVSNYVVITKYKGLVIK